MENLKNSTLSRNKLRGEINDINYAQFLTYLSKNIHLAPFNLKEISSELRIDHDIINGYFENLRNSFSLFKQIEQKHQWGGVVNNSLGTEKQIYQEYHPLSSSNESSIPISSSSSSSSSTVIEITQEQLQILSLFKIISHLNPVSEKIMNKKKKFSDLLIQYNILFTKSPKGYSLSDLGRHINEQYESYQKLNMQMVPIKFNSYEVRVKYD